MIEDEPMPSSMGVKASKTAPTLYSETPLTAASS